MSFDRLVEGFTECRIRVPSFEGPIKGVMGRAEKAKEPQRQSSGLEYAKSAVPLSNSPPLNQATDPPRRPLSKHALEAGRRGQSAARTAAADPLSHRLAASGAPTAGLRIVHRLARPALERGGVSTGSLQRPRRRGFAGAGGRGGAQLVGLALQVAHRRPAGREVLADPVLVERMVERPTGHREVADEAIEAALVTPLLLLVFGGRGRAGGTTCDVISSNEIYLPLYVAL